MNVCLSFDCPLHNFAVLLELRWSFSSVTEQHFSSQIPILVSKGYYFNVFWCFLFCSAQEGEGWCFFFCNFSAKEAVIMTAVWFLSYYANRNNEAYTCSLAIFLSIFLSISNYHASSRVYTLRSNLGMNRITPILKKKPSRSKVGYMSISKRNQ